jgi:hypothetical protein
MNLVGHRSIKVKEIITQAMMIVVDDMSTAAQEKLADCVWL